MYFVHSFMVMPHHLPPGRRFYLRWASITAVVARGNIWGRQFHPEKSGAAGLRLLGFLFPKLLLDRTRSEEGSGKELAAIRVAFH